MEQLPAKVLVVDDNPEIRDIIHVLLEGEGIRVTEAADGSSALHFLEKDSFDLIILDIMMPGLNGYETCQKIRQLTNVPILFLSARTSDSDKLMGFSSGGDDYLANAFFSCVSSSFSSFAQSFIMYAIASSCSAIV